ncbi:MAG: MazF family transcriptional regulator [Deltaproteobacteria bacterium HGW-Deltaproteobacteria-21]|nr:MAG: MazF family transcriptional regulator [Deltaproteobacteria bacterium HGW-Deltaproteobacteria-21]
MVTPSARAVVLVPFPFSNLAKAKLRPAVVLADAGRGDWILCQVTSNPYADPHAVELTAGSFAQGSLRITSYARPGKLFTASQELIVSQAGILNPAAFQVIVESVIHILQTSLSAEVH